MKLPHWQDLSLEAEVLPEPIEDAHRIVFWAKGDRDQNYQYWERIGSVARAEITVDRGLCTAPAVTTPMKERLGGSLAKLWARLRGPKGDRTLLLPNGRPVEQSGERQTDVVLVWTEDLEALLDSALVKELWPAGKCHRRLAKNLFLVSGLGEQPKNNEPEPVAAVPATTASPRETADQALAAARQSGDPQREAQALIDLGAVVLNEGDAHGAVSFLEPALVLARQLGDQTKQSDALGNLGMAALTLRQPKRAGELLEQELVLARGRKDLFAEKLALERLGLVSWHLGNPRQALFLFEQALALTRKVGDRHQEATLLWHQGIQHAELGQRDVAIAKAEESVTLQKLLGKPQAGWFGAQLQKYRMGLDEESGPAMKPDPGDVSPEAYLGGSIVASVMSQPAPQAAGTARRKGGPGMLRMALSATKAMANFVGAGFQTAPPEMQQKRLQTCAACEHFTGMRCKICGCFIQVKSRMLSEDCPIGKWPAVPGGA
jgi:tetratricopeptide (TPR) repeat protein